MWRALLPCVLDVASVRHRFDGMGNNCVLHNTHAAHTVRYSISKQFFCPLPSFRRDCEAPDEQMPRSQMESGRESSTDHPFSTLIERDRSVGGAISFSHRTFVEIIDKPDECDQGRVTVLRCPPRLAW